METNIKYSLAFASGILSHIFYFRHGEHHLQVTRYIATFFTTFFLSTLILHLNHPSTSWTTSLNTILTYTATYFTGLYISLSLYRTLFHPLKSFPGPLFARLSGFYLPIRLRKSDGFRQLQSLHAQYGPFVRLGPSDLSIVHPSSVQAIFGPTSQCTKGSFYDFGQPVVSLQTTRDRSFHDNRRRIWSTAFGQTSLRGYEKRITSYQDKLVSRLSQSSGAVVNAKQWFSFYAFDVMGELAFGRSFDMLATAKNHRAIKMMDDGVHFLAYMMPIWVFRLAMAVPGVTRDFWALMGFSRGRLVERMMNTPEVPDITSAFLAPLKGREPTKQELDLLTGESLLVITAGSDTSATTLISIFYLLARHPKQITRLREEIASHVDGTSVSSEMVAHLDHLNGVINEALRLFPPVPSAMYRKTPPEGITIDGTYIPGDMTVWSSQYILARDEACYAEPNSFVPERWYKYPDMVKNKSVFAPFSLGPYGCIGKSLALMSIRMTVSKIILNFDVGLAPGDDGSSFETKAREHFLLAPGDLNLVFTKRTVE